ncbi:MAG: RDD family protein [Gammaproteobacteria bacterium]
MKFGTIRGHPVFSLVNVAMTPANPSSLPQGAARVSLARRIGAILYDALVLAGLVLFVLGLVIIPLGMALGQQRWEQVQQEWWIRLLIQCLTLAVLVGFHVVFWVRGGQTVGMRAWRVKVVGDNGGPLTTRTALLRYAAAWLSALPLGLGFLWSLWDAQGLSWHDRWSKTRLVKLEKGSGAGTR